MEIVSTIVIVMAVLYGLLMLWYRYGWQRLVSYQSSTNSSFTTRVSVLVPARNEEKFIIACLDAILAQSYPSEFFEIIVINDHSTDRTAELVQQFIDNLPYGKPTIRLVNLQDHLRHEKALNSYKKKAIETAVNLATGDFIITTDADCIMNSRWIETLTGFYESSRLKFIAAPVSFYKENSFFKAFQSLDFLSMQGITGATVYLNCGTMCNGANLAYEKQAFMDVGGYQGVDCIASGDDMLLMYKMYKAFPKGIGFVKHPWAIVRTLPAEGLKNFLQQRIRWASKADKYDDKRITTVLAFVYLWNVILTGLFIAGFFYPLLWLFCLGAIFYKTLIELIFLTPVARFFQKSRLLWLFFPAQFLHIPYIVVAGWLGKFGHYEWKGRNVK